MPMSAFGTVNVIQVNLGGRVFRPSMQVIVALVSGMDFKYLSFDQFSVGTTSTWIFYKTKWYYLTKTWL